MNQSEHSYEIDPPPATSEFDRIIEEDTENVKKAIGGKDTNYRLTKAVFRQFLMYPERYVDTIKWTEDLLERYFKPTGKHPIREETYSSILLAACMGVTELSISEEALRQNTGLTEPQLGPEGCYVVKRIITEDEYLVPEYGDPKKDSFMRAAVPIIVAAGKTVEEQSYNPENPLHRFRPIWDLEARLREELSEKKEIVQKLVRPSQIPEDLKVFNSFDPERLRQNNAQFLRNIMEYLVLLTHAVLETNPKARVEELKWAAISNVEAAERAAQYAHPQQRGAMNFPGALYEKIRAHLFHKDPTPLYPRDAPQPHPSFHPTNVIKPHPHMYPTEYGNYVIYGLAKKPKEASMCPGAMEQISPALGITTKSDAIYLLTLLSAYAIAPWTLWKDIPATKDKKDSTTIFSR